MRCGVWWIIVGLLLAVSLVPSVPGDETSPQSLKRFAFAETHMGTRFQVTLYSDDEKTANRSAQAAFKRVAELDAIMSDYNSSSELMQLCAQAPGKMVKLSDDLFFVLARAQEIASASDGAFDVTLGPVTRLWRLARKAKRIPGKEERQEALALVGYRQLRLDPASRSAALAQKGMRLDLGGIAKGYAAEQALLVLKKHGIPRALVAAAGDIAAGDPPPNATGWRIGIAPVVDPDAPAQRFLWLSNASVSTSGDARQYIEIEGKRYSHIVDPSKGIGLEGQFSVTVLARHGADADALATTIAVLGPERGLKLAQQQKVEALFVQITQDGEQSFRTAGFKDEVTKENHP